MNTTDMESFIRLLGLDPTDTLGNVVLRHQGPSPLAQVKAGAAKPMPSWPTHVVVPVAVSVGVLGWSGSAVVSLQGCATCWVQGDEEFSAEVPDQLLALRSIARGLGVAIEEAVQKRAAEYQEVEVIEVGVPQPSRVSSATGAMDVRVTLSLGADRWVGTAVVRNGSVAMYDGTGVAVFPPDELKVLDKRRLGLVRRVKAAAVHAVAPVSVVCRAPVANKGDLAGSFDVPVSAELASGHDWHGVVIIGGDRKFIAFRSCSGLPGGTPPGLERLERQSEGVIKLVKERAVAAVQAPEQDMDLLVQACCDFIHAVHSDGAIEEAAVKLDDQLHEAEWRFGWDL